ncbi:MAG: tetratricopeptide repeat protein [Rhodopirellula sp.]|nr:tetratricopeptide repeat protein [Rhodopirellula sp.]
MDRNSASPIGDGSLHGRLIGRILLLVAIVAPAPLRAAPGPVEALRPVEEPKDARTNASPDPGPLVLEEKPQPLVPGTAPSREHRDRLEALAMFSAARLLENRGDEAEALRLYQRALRFDPEAATVARQVVLLAYRMGRHAEAVRYALQLIDLEESDPLLLNQLAIYLTDQGQWQRAIKLYESAVGAGGKNPSTADVLLRMQMGRLYHLVEEYEKAAESFAIVLEALGRGDSAALDEPLKKVLLGDAGATYNLVGETFLLAGRLEEASAAFQQAHRADPNKGLLNYHLAEVDLRRGKPDEALAKLELYFAERLSSEAMEPYRLLAKVLEALGREQDLTPKLEAMVAEDGQNVPLGYALAERYRETGPIDKAESLYRELLARAPATVGYRSLVELYRQTGKTEELLGVLGEAVAKTSSLHPLGEAGRAIAADASLLGKLVEAARKRSRAPSQDRPYGLVLAVALLALDAKDYDAAGEFFDRAVEAKPDESFQLLLTWGLALLADEQFSSAAEVFRRGVKPDGKPENNAIFNFYLAAALEMDGHTDSAIAAATAAAKVKSDDPRFLGRVAWILHHAKRYEEAAKVYRELIDKFDSDHNSADIRDPLRDARFVLSNIAVTQQDFALAEERLEQILDEFPDDVGAMNDLGYLWVDQNKNLHRAHRMIRAAVDEEPENAAYRDSLGWALYRLGRFDEAVLELEKAVAIDPEPMILDHLGDAYCSLQRMEKAADAWRKAQEGFQADGDAAGASRIKQKIGERSP